MKTKLTTPIEILKLIGPSQTMGHRFLSYTGLQPYTATAIEDFRVCFIELGCFKNLMQKNDNLQEDLSRQTASDC